YASRMAAERRLASGPFSAASGFFRIPSVDARHVERDDGAMRGQPGERRQRVVSMADRLDHACRDLAAAPRPLCDFAPPLEAALPRSRPGAHGDPVPGPQAALGGIAGDDLS